MSEPIRPAAPSLPSTADATPYAPVSWLAVAAIVVAGSYALILLIFGTVAFINKKVLVGDGLLLPPVIALVLSFAARRTIRNSEGTRTGEGLANTAWWLALILGLCYAAYMRAIDYAVHREVEGEVQRWMDHLKNGSEEEQVARAFHRTLPPGARQDIPPYDADRMRGRFRDEFLVFSNSDLVRLAQRNPDTFKFVPGSVTWRHIPGAIECLVLGTVECREGTFPAIIPLRGGEGVTGSGSSGRQWVITRPQNTGFIDQSKVQRTPYGWLVSELEKDGGGFGMGFVSHLRGPSSLQYAYRGFIVPGGDWVEWGFIAGDPSPHRVLQLAFAGPSSALGDAGYADYLDKHLFKLRGGAEPPPDMKTKFLASWREFGVRPAGEKLKDPSGGTPDRENAITITDTALEVRVPVEIPLLPDRPGGKIETARGRLVVTCTDPALLELVKRHKESADSEPKTTGVPPELRAELMERFKNPRDPAQLAIPWRVVRVESDLAPVIITAPQRQGAPGGPSGPPGGP
jgi:hypothetical protein